MMAAKLTQERVKELFSYNPEMGVFVWRVDRTTSAKAGSPAGCLTDRGQYLLRVDGKLIDAGRVAWLMTYGTLPKRVAYKNRDSQDVRLCNIGIPYIDTLGLKPKQPLSIKQLMTLLSYNENDGSFSYAAQPTRKNSIGDRADRMTGDGYSVISVNGIQYKAHRLALAFKAGQWPSDHVDHIDGNPSNNRLENLRVAGRCGNMQNRLGHSSSGEKGVYWNERHKAWAAEISANKKRYFIGRFKSKQDAAEAYRNAAKRLHGKYARLR